MANIKTKKNGSSDIVHPSSSNSVDILPGNGTRKPGKKTSLSQAPLPSPEDVLDKRELLQILTEVKNGNFSVRMPIDKVGLNGKICDTLNEIISLNEKMMQEFTRAGNTIGKQGKLTQRIEAPWVKDPGVPA
jgi:hypothetical protein